MPLIKNKYGKGRVRVMRIHRDGDKHEVSQLNVKAMIEGDFARAYTHADNSTAVSTDTIKNVVNIVARQNTGLCTEEFCEVLAKTSPAVVRLGELGREGIQSGRRLRHTSMVSIVSVPTGREDDR